VVALRPRIPLQGELKVKQVRWSGVAALKMGGVTSKDVDSGADVCSLFVPMLLEGFFGLGDGH
jgi:hypothetical protein